MTANSPHPQPVLTRSPVSAARSLSPAQHKVLCVTYAVYDRRGWLGRDDVPGVPWLPPLHRVSRAASASRSRALARLERRGLVRRVASHRRTTHVVLTPAGLVLAAQLRADLDQIRSLHP
jgi:DNA-binding MarR family transcriptional regulator